MATEFNVLLQTVMDQKGLSVKQVARIAGVASGSVTRWLNNISKPAPSLQTALLTELRAQPDKKQVQRTNKKKKTPKKALEVVYGVPWIEVEFGWGERPSGWALYATKETAITRTKDASRAGVDSGDYIGPVRPLSLYEIPLDCLDLDQKIGLKKYGVSHTEDYWTPKFKGTRTEID